MSSEEAFLEGGGEAGAIMRGIRWDDTPLGRIDKWPRNLRTIVRVMLASGFAMRVVWGPEFIFLYNDAYRPILGATKHPSAMGSRTYESFREVWDTVGPMFKEVLAGKTFSHEDIPLPLNRNGYVEECYFRLSYSPIFDDDGNIGGVLGVVHETTLRVLAERRLATLHDVVARMAEARTIEDVCARATESLASNGADVPFALLYANDASAGGARLVASAGVANGAAVAPERIALEERREEGAWPLGQALARSGPYVVEDVTARFGEVHAGPWTEPVTKAIVFPLTGASRAAPIGFLVVGVNPRHTLDDNYVAFFSLAAEHVAKAIASLAAHAEERRIAEALASAAQAAERAANVERGALYQLFMEAPMAISIFRGEELRIELANDGILVLWGKPREVVGKIFDDALPELRGFGFDDLLRGVLRTGAAYHGSEALVHLDRGGPQRDECYFNFVYAPLHERDGSISGVLVCATEVTDQVVARRRVERLATELAAQKEALVAADRMKDEFLATMSHELRSPLHAILGWTRMLGAGAVPDARKAHALDTIERNAVAQTKLVDDLLDISRIITGKVRLTVAPVDLPTVVSGAIETSRPAADAKGVSLHAVIDSNAGPIMGDADRLVQVVTNLVLNAVKFTPKGGRVHVHLERVSSAVRLTVRDNGVGIPHEFLPFVFERFRQADQAITRKHGGLGLGLSIVKHLIELHGGTIAAASEGQGRGASFVVTLPLAAVQPPRADDVGDSPSIPPANALQGLRAIVVDDEPDSRDLIASILSTAGVDVRAIASADAAFQELASFAPHVLVCDIGMPEEDGLSFMRRVRALPAEQGGRVRAVAVTAYARIEDRRRALSAGFNMHLAKPVDPSELLAGIASIAERYTPV